MTTIQGPTGTKGQRATARRWPVTKGLTAATNKQEGRVSNLVPKHSYLKKNDRVGL